MCYQCVLFLGTYNSYPVVLVIGGGSASKSATMPVTVLISSFAPFGNFCINADADSTISDLFEDLTLREPLLSKVGDLRLYPTSRPLAQSSTPLSELCGEDASLVSFRLAPSVLGGKGGFGSQLRAAGGRMSSQRTSNNDSCRDLSGRRLSTVKEAKKCVLRRLLFRPCGTIADRPQF